MQYRAGQHFSTRVNEDPLCVINKTSIPMVSCVLSDAHYLWQFVLKSATDHNPPSFIFT